MPLAATTALQWAGILVPTLAVCVGAIGVYAAFHPQREARRLREEEIQTHLQRGENAINLIFGVKGDDSRGLLPQRGILDRLAAQDEELEKIKEVLGVDGHTPPRSVMQILESAEAERRDTRRQLETLARYLRRPPQPGAEEQ